MAFFGWQAINPNEPLIPLQLVRHRNFLLSNAGIALVSFAFVAFLVPLMIFLEEAYGLSPLRAALLTAPMAVATVVLAPVVGTIVDRVDPPPDRHLRIRTAGGRVVLAGAGDDTRHRCGGWCYRWRRWVRPAPSRGSRWRSSHLVRCPRSSRAPDRLSVIRRGTLARRCRVPVSPR